MKYKQTNKHIKSNMNLLIGGLKYFVAFYMLYLCMTSINGIQWTNTGLYINLDSTIYSLIKPVDNKYIQWDCN